MAFWPLVLRQTALVFAITTVQMKTLFAGSSLKPLLVLQNQHKLYRQEVLRWDRVRY
jgi:hypothetical protein